MRAIIVEEHAHHTAAEAALQAAIDAEAAARIAADETLDGKIADIISNTNAPIIDSFTEVVDNLNAEITRAESAESSLEDNKLSRDGSQAMTGNLEMDGNYINGASIVSTDQVQTNDVQTKNLSSYGGSEIILTTNLDSNGTATVRNLPTPQQAGDAVNKQYVDDVRSDLDNEVNNRAAGDAQLQSNLDSAIAQEVSDRIAGDENLQSEIDSLTQTVNVNITDGINNESTLRIAGDSNLQAEIDLLPLTDGDTIEVDLVNNYVRLKEVVAAPDSGVRTFEGDIKVGAQPDTLTGSYNELSLITKGILDNRVSNEVSTINNSISEEVSRAQNAEGVLQSNIDNQKVRIDAILEAAGSETDNFVEIVALINSVDTTNDEVFAGYVLSNNQRLTIEEQ